MHACSDHIEFNAQIPASYSSGEVVQSNSNQRSAWTSRTTNSEQLHQNVHLHWDRFHCRHRLPESTGIWHACLFSL